MNLRYLIHGAQSALVDMLQQETGHTGYTWNARGDRILHHPLISSASFSYANSGGHRTLTYHHSSTANRTVRTHVNHSITAQDALVLDRLCGRDQRWPVGTRHWGTSSSMIHALAYWVQLRRDPSWE